MTTLDNRYELVRCDASRADEALEMLNVIRAELVELGREEYYCMEESDDEFRDFYANPQYITLGVVACETNELVATGSGSFNRHVAEQFAPALGEDVQLDAIGYVEFIQVAPQRRGNGLQTVLFDALEKELVDKGAVYLVGTVSPLNQYSLRNFQRAGYREVGQTTLSNGYPRLLMAKKTSR